MLRQFDRLFLSALAALVVGCGEPAPPSAAGSAVFTMEEYCTLDRHQSSLRQTFLFIDERTLRQPAQASESPGPEPAGTSLNEAVRNVVLAFGDPDRANQTGVTDYRERITLLLAPRDGAAAEVLFEGCVPGLSPEELAVARRRGSSAEAFFTGGVDQKLQNDREEFRRRIALALGKASQEAEGDATPHTGSLTDSNIIESIRASNRLINGDQGLPRIVILSNLARIDLGDAESREDVRERGFRDGARSGLDLGRSEVHVFLVEGRRSALARDYAEAFFLIQHGSLLSWTEEQPTSMPPAPVGVARFEGEAIFSTPDWEPRIWVRIAYDRNGSMVNSWITLREPVDRSIPLSGIRSCEAPNDCAYRAEGTVFAQVWRNLPDFEGEEELSPSPRVAGAEGEGGAGYEASVGASRPSSGGSTRRRSCPNDASQAEFCDYYPFLGVRSWEFQELEGEHLTGRLFDPGGRLRIGIGSDDDGIKIDARRQDEARF